MNNFIRLLADTSGTDTTPASSLWSTVGMLVPLLLMAVAFYFFLLRPQKKQQRQADTMRNSIARGDVITTVGGIVGIVIMVKDDNILIETSGDKTRVQIQKWAVRSIEKKSE